MTTPFKCTNPFCPYGPDWDAGVPDRFAGEEHPEQFRADAYSQHPEYRPVDTGYAPWDGLCLNCIDDRNRESLVCEGAGWP